MNNDLASRYKKQLCDAFSVLIPRDKPVALVDFPDTMNCSDHAIWLGEKKVLWEIGANLVYQCSTQTYVRDEMAAKLQDGTILFHGTANANGRSAVNREFRLRVRSDFPKNEAIVFPRQDPLANEDYLRHDVNALQNSLKLTLFASSLAARQTLERHFGTLARVELAPDPTFMLGRRARATEPIYDIVWIARTDGDKANAQTEVAARLSSQAAEKFSIPGFADGIEMSFVAKREAGYARVIRVVRCRDEEAVQHCRDSRIERIVRDWRRRWWRRRGLLFGGLLCAFGGGLGRGG
jgi:exopolysaccharide biosynthesis predicted pyruvyltransferase EpsI